jgi:hypothetical protein
MCYGYFVLILEIDGNTVKIVNRLKYPVYDMEELEMQLERTVFKKHFVSLWSMRIAQSFIDVTFIVDSTQFHAHKVILIAQSDYFRRYFSCNECLPYSDMYNINDISPRIFHHFLEVLYGMTPSVEDWREMIHLCHYIIGMGMNIMIVDVLILKMLRTVCPTLNASVFHELCRKIASIYVLQPGVQHCMTDFMNHLDKLILPTLIM